MSTVNMKILEMLIKLIEEAFSNCSIDRKRLHNIEWEASDSFPSILGEIDVRGDTVIGITKTCFEKKPDDIDQLINALEITSIYKSDSIVNWIINESNDFQEFLKYIVAIESLRVSIMTFLKK